MSEEPLIITVSDARRAGYCVKGIRTWLDARGVDYRDFMRNGIAADDERIAGDEYLARVIAAKQRAAR